MDVEPLLDLSLLVVVVLVLATATAVHGSGGPTGSTVVVNFNVPVDPGSAALMTDALNTAKSMNAPAIVIEMNTPGGLLSDMTAIISTIDQANASGIPTYTYVPPDSLAASAGSYIAMASNKILMGPGSEIGPSTPIVVGGTSLEQNHTEGAMESLMASLAQKWNRNTTAATNMVSSDIAYSAADAYRLQLINGNATSLQEALSKLGLNGGYVTVQESVYDQLLSALSDPTLDGILILLGVVAIALDLFHPTILLSVAGAVGIVSGLVGAEVVGASILGIIVLIISAGMIFLELKLGHGLAMMGGMAVGAIGVYLLFQGVSYSPSPISNVTQIELVAVVAAGILGGLYVRWVAGPLRRKRGMTGPESLIGKSGTVTSELSPQGEVRVEGITWRARSVSGTVAKGESVRVCAIEGLVLVVEKADLQA